MVDDFFRLLTEWLAQILPKLWNWVVPALVVIGLIVALFLMFGAD